jgi:metallo-beta-lactamase family protein
MAANGLKLTFHGAAQSVTGSMHMVEAGGRRIVLDCGLVQGHRKEAFEQNRRPFVEPRSIDLVLLSHAHLDHSGNLPTLLRLGFRGKVYATPATVDLCEVMLRDSANLQVREVELVNRLRQEQGKRPFEPLYDERDVEALMAHFVAVPYGRPIPLGDGLAASFHDAGHILGSALTLVEVGRNGASRKLLFTGDLGRKGSAILRDPEPLPRPDCVITESTYGDRKHPPAEQVKAQLSELIGSICRLRSKLIIPAFAVERTQQIIYYLHQLLDDGRIPRVPIYLDSPLASKATAVFRRHKECYDEEANAFALNGEQPFSFDTLQYVESTDDSKKLNDMRGPLVIISSSGMCEGGRVLHHLVHGVGDPNNVVLLVGYQAPDTLGRKLADGVSPVNILGRPYPVRAKVTINEALSAHADADEMVEYFRESDASPARAFLVHGEPPQAQALKSRLQGQLGWKDVAIPAPGESFSI